MIATLENDIHKIASELSSDPIKQALAERLILSFSKSINSISSNDAQKALKLNDIDFSLKVGNILAEDKISIEHEKQDTKAINDNKKTQEFIQKLEVHGGTYTSKQLEAKFKIAKAAITNRKNRNSLFSVKVGGRVYFPKFQFTDNMEVTKPFKDVLNILSGKDPIACFFFFLEKVNNHQDEEKTIYEILKDTTQKRYIYSIIERRAKLMHKM